MTNPTVEISIAIQIQSMVDKTCKRCKTAYQRAAENVSKEKWS